MSVVSSITTVAGIAVGSIGATDALLNDDGTINKKNGRNALITSVASTGTLVAAALVNAHEEKEMKEKYRKSYIESLSDEELERALIQIGELSAESNQDNANKTI